MNDSGAFLFAGFVLILTGAVVANGPRERGQSFWEDITSSGSIGLGVGLLLVIYSLAAR
jgi:hypothetical protein